MKSPGWSVGTAPPADSCRAMAMVPPVVMMAIVFIGPALVPGLMSAGLIILALGSIKLLNEKLGKEEIIGILLMIVGITFLGLSELAIDVSTFNILDSGFIIRLIAFTIVIILIAIIFHVLHSRDEKHKGLLMAIEAGLILSLNTVWASPGITVVTHVIDGVIINEEITFGIFIGIVVIIIMVVGITLGQISLKYGQANILVPLTSVPIQIIPVLAFFIVFLSVPSSIFSLIFLILGFILVIGSSFLLSKRQAKLEEIQPVQQ